MKRWKLTALSALAAICLLMTACSTTEETSSTAPAAVIQAAKNKAKVSVAREESFTFTDKTGNEYDTDYRIPSVNFDTDDAAAVNREITGKFTSDFEQAEQESAQRLSLTCDSLDFEKFENRGVLSIVIRKVYFSHAIEYTVYNFDATSGKRLDNAAVAKAVGLSENQALSALKTELGADYRQKYQTSSQPENYEENYDKTMSEKNLSDALLYLDKDGKLTAICKEYASVGTGEFSVMLILN